MQNTTTTHKVQPPLPLLLHLLSSIFSYTYIHTPAPDPAPAPAPAPQSSNQLTSQQVQYEKLLSKTLPQDILRYQDIKTLTYHWINQDIKIGRESRKDGIAVVKRTICLSSFVRLPFLYITLTVHTNTQHNRNPNTTRHDTTRHTFFSLSLSLP